MGNNYYTDLLISFRCCEGLYSCDTLLKWINDENKKTKAILKNTIIDHNSFWFYDDRNFVIKNRNNSFFSISGIKQGNIEQPIIIQNEIGYLGFIGKKINGVLHFLMQAKIEPGNINNVQISPTIQATESNFTQKHGGRAPYYLDYFKNVSNYFVVYDGKEPEQCSRFFKKYNRNVIIILKEDENFEVLDQFRWMTIGQIKYLANHYNNLVNMDTRTVLSCIQYDLSMPRGKTPLLNSIFGKDDSDFCINEIKKHQKQRCSPDLIRLDNLAEWEIKNSGIFCKKEYPFHFEFFDISIDGREVTHWTQPLAVANGKALFCLAYFIKDETMFFLIKIQDEIGCEFGSCFGPTIQLEAPFSNANFINPIEKGILQKMSDNKCDVSTILSEEGGRFYHEENQNVICQIDSSFSDKELLKMGYYPVTYKTIRKLIEKTHMVNIQLRNLLSLLVDKNEKN